MTSKISSKNIADIGKYNLKHGDISLVISFGLARFPQDQNIELKYGPAAKFFYLNEGGEYHQLPNHLHYNAQGSVEDNTGQYMNTITGYVITAFKKCSKEEVNPDFENFIKKNKKSLESICNSFVDYFFSYQSKK
jgi:hypothetical protein